MFTDHAFLEYYIESLYEAGLSTYKESLPHRFLFKGPNML